MNGSAFCLHLTERSCANGLAVQAPLREAKPVLGKGPTVSIVELALAGIVTEVASLL